MNEIIITIDNNNGLTTLSINSSESIIHTEKPTKHLTGDWEHHRFHRYRFTSARRGKKLSQADVGKHLGVSQSCVNSWENGPSFPGRHLIDPIAKLFGVSRAYVLGTTVIQGKTPKTVEEGDDYEG